MCDIRQEKWEERGHTKPSSAHRQVRLLWLWGMLGRCLPFILTCTVPSPDPSTSVCSPAAMEVRGADDMLTSPPEARRLRDAHGMMVLSEDAENTYRPAHSTSTEISRERRAGGHVVEQQVGRQWVRWVGQGEAEVGPCRPAATATTAPLWPSSCCGADLQRQRPTRTRRWGFSSAHHLTTKLVLLLLLLLMSVTLVLDGRP